jgi:putative Holliday junction resolvase
MVFDNLDGLRLALRRNARLLGLDVGTKTIGLALSDIAQTIATPLETIRRTKFTIDAERLRTIAAEHDVGGFIIGLPISMDGSEGPRCQSVRQFTTNLLAIVDLPTGLWDERLSTAAVQRMMTSEADLTRKRRAGLVDKLAAAYILQGAIDAMNHQAETDRSASEIDP